MVRSQAWTEISQQLDRDGDCDGAMAAMLQAKRFAFAKEGPFRKESETLVGLLGNLAGTLTTAPSSAASGKYQQ